MSDFVCGIILGALLMNAVLCVIAIWITRKGGCRCEYCGNTIKGDG